jgi:ketosteroid isomerase-like protein
MSERTFTMADLQQNKKIVEDFLATFSAGDIDGVGEGLTDDATWWVLGSIDNFSGSYTKQEMLNLLPNFKTVYTTGALKIEPRTMTAEDDRVAVEAEGHAELANGRVYNPLYHFLFQVRDGKVASVREYLDTDHGRATFFSE